MLLDMLWLEIPILIRMKIDDDTKYLVRLQPKTKVKLAIKRAPTLICTYDRAQLMTEVVH